MHRMRWLSLLATLAEVRTGAKIYARVSINQVNRYLREEMFTEGRAEYYRRLSGLWCLLGDARKALRYWAIYEDCLNYIERTK